MELFPHVMPKTMTSVNVKPKIVIQRVSQSQADFSRISLRDIFYKLENTNMGEELRLRASPTNSKVNQQQLVVEEAEEPISGSDMEGEEYEAQAVQQEGDGGN
jgi:hypothetical protein